MVRERWRIRRADVSDAPGIAAAHVRSWSDAYSDLLPPEEFEARPVEVRTQQWSERLADSDYVASVAIADGEVLGFVGVKSADAEDSKQGKTGEVAALYLVQGAWNQGLGRKLLEIGTDCLRSRGFARAVLWVLRDNERGRRFYSANGWTFDGGEKDCFGGVTAPAVRYERSLSGDP